MGQRLVNGKLAVMNLLKRIIDKYTHHHIAQPVRLILPYKRYPPFRTFLDNFGLHLTALFTQFCVLFLYVLPIWPRPPHLTLETNAIVIESSLGSYR